MNWLQHAGKLQAGETIQFRPKGPSMSGKVESGQLCTVAPYAKDTSPEVDDIVLCKVKGTFYLHLVKAINGDTYQIGNNRGHINGWTSRNCIYGKCIEVSD
jgi:hypothetical protein